MFSIQAVGQEVMAMAMIGIGMLGWLAYLLKPLFSNLYIKLLGNQVQVLAPAHPPQYGGGECAICLTNPKVYEVSATCGHTYCGACITETYIRLDNKINCPLCRKPITTMFKMYIDDPLDEECLKISGTVLSYNRTYDDNRPFLRRLIELPYIITRVRRFVCSPRFIVYFIQSIYFLRAIMFFICYLLLPFDIVPEKIFGMIGFVDDIIIGFAILLFMMSIGALIFMRRQA